MSTATPSLADWQLAAPFVQSFEHGEIDRRGYWRGVQAVLRQAHPELSGHDVTRLARIMAPFPLRDGHYAPR